MSQINIQFPWFVLVDNEDESLLVVMGDGAFMVAIFTCQEFAEMYNERIDASCTVFEVSGIDEAITLLEHVSTPAEGSGHVLQVCIDPIDPHGDEDGTAFEIDDLVAELRRVNG
jgi:hypothetical protein